MEKAITINDTLHLVRYYSNKCYKYLLQIPVDLRDCPALEKLLVSAGFDGKSVYDDYLHLIDLFRRPTLILSECALIYLPSHCSDQVC